MNPVLDITEYSLEMRSSADLKPKPLPTVNFVVRQVMHPTPELNRFFYTAVGGDWYWVDRLAWTYDEWTAYIDRPELQTWVGYLDGSPAGYFELERQPDNVVEITSFGLLKPFIGKGLGGYFLSECIRRGWAWNAQRVWVHTCSLDHPAALANYQARGLRVFNERDYQQEMPAEPIGPWLGAYASGK